MIERARAHLRRLWPNGGAWLPLPVVAYLLYWFVAGERHWERVAVMIAVLLLAYFDARTKRLFVGLYPIALLGVVYDAMRFVKNAGITPERVHDCDLRAIDMRIASVTIDGVPGSVHEWLQRHWSPVLDVICAVPYGVFIYAALAFSVFLYLKDYDRLRAFVWTFFALNIAGFVTYHVYPAAPPWYFHAHGCTVDLTAHSSEGPNLARVDAMLGFRYFAGFYARSNDVFGAMPSLHVAYPMLITLYGWPVFGRVLRASSLVFLVTMCFAAVYLDHHWIIDVVVGLAYTVIVFLVVGRLMRRRAPPQPQLREAHPGPSASAAE